MFEIGVAMRRKLQHSPRAMSLIEVMVVMTVASIVLSAATGLIVQLRRWDNRVRENVLVGDEASRLAEIIRDDIRNATNVTKTSPTVLTILGRNSEETRYTLQSDLCRREVKKPGTQAANMDTFTIGPSAAWQVEPAAAGRGPAFAISLERPSPEQTTTRTAPLYIYAVQSNEQ